jgi:hypothetical protein
MDLDTQKTAETKTTSTPNTRRTVRRKNTDRRVEVRFEPEKQNRRQNKGRRSTDIDHWGP